MTENFDQEDAPIEVPIDGTLDLHQFPPQAIGELLPDYIALCHQRGIHRLRIIHGKGIGTLRTRVNARLKKEALVTDFHLAQIDEGGWGATIVYLGAPLETSHVPRLLICCDGGKALSPTVGLEALPWREQRRQRTVSGKSFKPKHFWF